MSSARIEPIRNCHNCAAPVPLGALTCDQCHTLLHSEDLLRISTAAKSYEEQGRLTAARLEWQKALPLLPYEATQAQWVRQKIYKLEVSENNSAKPPADHKWAKWLGPLAPIAIFLAKAKGLIFAIFKFKFIFSLFAFIAVYWTLFGAKFAVGFVLLILIHEMGHDVDIRRRGLPAEMPVFLPGLGAYIRWTALGVSRRTIAEVSLAGPLAGLLGSVACAALWWKTREPFWAALAHVGGWMNVFNLTPVWVLDGSQAEKALGRVERFFILAAALFLWWLSREGIFFVVSAGATWRLFTKDLPPATERAIALYFIAVMAALGVLLWLVPKAGF